MKCDKVTKVDTNIDMVDSGRNGPMRKSKNLDKILKIEEKLSDDDNGSDNTTDIEESIPTKQPKKRKKVANTAEQVRDEAIRMKTTYRATMQRKMRMQRQKCVEERSAQLGDCVKMSLDKRDIPHARGLLGVVCNVARGGGIQVVTRAGVISCGGKVYYVPMDKYSIITVKAIEAVVPTELQKVRAALLCGQFKQDLSKQTSMAAAYKEEYYGSAIVTGGCKCNKTCRGNCGCRKKKMACGDGCNCGGVCVNPFNT
jgi:hypothetical protein